MRFLKTYCSGGITWLNHRLQYTEILRSRDLRWRRDGKPGPMHPNQPEGKSLNIDVLVMWTGAEKVGIRSLALRDEQAQVVLGQGHDKTVCTR